MWPGRGDRQGRDAAGEWAEGSQSLGTLARYALGILHAQASFPRRLEGNFAAALSASRALLALGEMVCVLGCEDILLGSSFNEEEGGLMGGQSATESESTQAMLLKNTVCVHP